MAEKRLTLAAGSYNLNVVRVTEVKESEEIDSDIVKTFDEPVPVPSSEGGYTIDVSTLEARSLADFITLKRIIKLMKTEAGTLSVFEDIKHKQGNFTVERHYTGVMTSGNESTMNAEDLTARDLTFHASQCLEKIGNEEI